MIMQGLSAVQNASPLFQAGAQKGAAIASLKHVAKAVYNKASQGALPNIPFVSGTTAAAIHAATKIPNGIESVYRDATASMTAVIVGNAVAKTNLPQPVKTAIVYTMVGAVSMLMDKTKANPKIGLILTGFYLGHKIMDKVCPTVQRVFMNFKQKQTQSE